MKIPEKIYLTRGDRIESWEECANDDLGIQQCSDRINDDDVEYIRKDIAEGLVRELLGWVVSIKTLNGDKLNTVINNAKEFLK